MTPRERLFAALNGESTDRVPVWLLFPYHALGCYVDVRTHPRYRPIHELAAKYAVTLDRRTLTAPLHAPEVVRYQEAVTGPSGPSVRSVFQHRGRRIFCERIAGPNGRTTKHFLETAEDLELFCSLPVETDPGRIEAALDRQLPRYLEEKAEFPAELGAMMLALGEPIGALYHSANLEAYALWSLTRHQTVAEWLERAFERHRLIYRYCLERDLADVYFMVGSELASPPLVGRETFRRWVVPCARDLIAMVHSFGKKVITHYHGRIREVLPDIVATGPDGLHTIEAPPVGDCALADAYRVSRDRVTLIGNIQYDEFRSAKPEEMAARVRSLVAESRGKRFILSPTAGPYDPDPPDRVIENYRVLLETAWECAW